MHAVILSTTTKDGGISYPGSANVCAVSSWGSIAVCILVTLSFPHEVSKTRDCLPCRDHSPHPRRWTSDHCCLDWYLPSVVNQRLVIRKCGTGSIPVHFTTYNTLTYTHTHTQIHTHINTPTHIHTHINTQTYTHSHNKHTHTHTITLTHIQTHTHIYTHSLKTHTHTYSHIHTHIHSPHTHIYTNTFTYTHIHKHTHSHILTNTHT